MLGVALLVASVAGLQRPHSRCSPATCRRAAAPAHETDDRWPGWTESVDGASELLYMPFLEHQLGVLGALGAAEVPSALPPHLALATKRTSGVVPRVPKCVQRDQVCAVLFTEEVSIGLHIREI